MAPFTVLIGRSFRSFENDRAAIHADLIFGPRQFGGAGGKNQVLRVECIRDIDRRKLLGVELVQIQIDHDGALFPAKRIGNGCTLDCAERSSDEVVTQIEDFLLAKRFAGEAELEDRNTGGVVLQDIRGEHARAASGAGPFAW